MGLLANKLSKIALRISSYKSCGSGVIRPDPGWHLPPHSHSVHELIVVFRGRLLLNSGKEQVVAKAGDVLFYRAGFVHEEASDPKQPCHTRFMAFTTGELLSWLPLLTHDASGRVRQLITWIVEDERTRRTPEMRSSLIEALFGELHQLCNAPSDPWFEDMLAHIHQNLPRNLTLDDLARHGGMSKFAFARKFKKISGRTPMKELRLARLDEARSLLLSTKLPIKAIAPAVGIGDEYQLSKLFRLHFKIAPRELRSRAPK